MVSAKPVIRVLSGVALAVALILHQRMAYAQSQPGVATGNAQSPSSADSAAAGSEPEKVDVSTIVVSGTRITSSGFTGRNAPRAVPQTRSTRIEFRAPDSSTDRLPLSTIG